MRQGSILVALLMFSTARCANPVHTAVPGNASKKARGSIVVPLCTVVENPKLYDGKRVTIDGCVTTDGREYVVLSNIEKPCPRGGIVPLDAPGLPQEQQFDAEPGQKVCGTFTGTFRATNALHARVIEVEETFCLTTSVLTE